jgi:hypothetical protein
MAKTLQELEEKYGEIMHLYDLADDLAATVDEKFVDDLEQQFLLVEPLIDQLGESTDVLTEEFINLAEGKPEQLSRPNIESALRKVYAAIDNYFMMAGAKLKQTVKSVRNIADPIVHKIKEELERVIVIFMEFVKLSLDTVMHKKELEELRRKEKLVAFQLHEVAQQQP